MAGNRNGNMHEERVGNMHKEMAGNMHEEMVEETVKKCDSNLHIRLNMHHICSVVTKVYSFVCLQKMFARILRRVNPFLPTVPTFAVRETSVSRTANVILQQM